MALPIKKKKPAANGATGTTNNKTKSAAFDEPMRMQSFPTGEAPKPQLEELPEHIKKAMRQVR